MDPSANQITVMQIHCKRLLDPFCNNKQEEAGQCICAYLQNAIWLANGSVAAWKVEHFSTFDADHWANRTDGPTMHFESVRCKVIEILRRTHVVWTRSHSHCLRPSTDGGFLTFHLFSWVVLQRRFHYSILAYICITQSAWINQKAIA